MNRIMLTVVSIITVNSLYGMEKEHQKTIRTAVFATYPKISVVQDDICNRHTKGTDIIVVGEVEQKKLKDKNFYGYGCVGNVTSSQDNVIAIKIGCNSLHGKKKTGQVILEHLKIKKNKDLCGSLTMKEMDSIVVHVFEPQLLIEGRDHNNKISYQYHVTRRLDEKTEKHKEYCGDEALQEARNDLGMCYINALEKAHEFFTHLHQEKSIAFTPLGALDFFFDDVAQVAVTSVLRFIKNSPNKDKYGSIELVVNSKEHFLLYMKIFDEQKINRKSYCIEDVFFVNNS